MCTIATSDQDSMCPGSQALTLIRDHLVDKEYEVSSPQWDGTHLLRVMNAPLALCDMTIDDTTAQWYYQPFLGHQGTAGDTAAMVTAILGIGDRARDPALPASQPVPSGHPHLAAVRNALTEFGLRVTCSELRGDAADLAQLEVSNLGKPDRGTVYVTSDHAVIWECKRPSSACGDAGFDFASIANTITRALAAASQ